jgi:AraC-like DNA-binding protein
MRVLAFLPDDSLVALKRALSSADVIGALPDALAIERAIAARRADAIVIDPNSFTSAEWARVSAMPALAHAPVLFYARLDPASVQRVVEASGAGVHEVLLREIDDDAIAIRRRLETLRRPPAPVQVLSRIASRIIALPPALQGTILSLFCAAPVPRWADELARLSSMSRRSVDRWLEHAELAGTASVLDVARLARVWTPIVEQDIPAADVAARSGYRRLRMLALHARKIVGVSPTLFKQQISESAFVDRLTRHAVRS